MSVKWIVSDLDGTLLDTDTEPLRIPESLCEAIRSWQESGGRFVLATGRPALTTRPILERMQLRIPLIVSNGALVFAEDGALLHRSVIESEEVRPLLRSLPSEMTCLLFTETEVYTTRFDAWTERYERKENKRISKWVDGTPCEFTKLLLIGPPEQLQSVWHQLPSVRKAPFHTMVSEPHYLEILKKDVDKGEGLRVLLAHHGLQKENVVSIGNQMNDASLLRASGKGYAVSNAVDALKQQADEVTAGAFSEGVEEILRRYTAALRSISGCDARKIS